MVWVLETGEQDWGAGGAGLGEGEGVGELRRVRTSRSSSSSERVGEPGPSISSSSSSTTFIGELWVMESSVSEQVRVITSMSLQTLSIACAEFTESTTLLTMSSIRSRLIPGVWV